jgi:hypothetical protein
MAVHLARLFGVRRCQYIGDGQRAATFGESKHCGLTAAGEYRATSPQETPGTTFVPEVKLTPPQEDAASSVLSATLLSSAANH